MKIALTVVLFPLFAIGVFVETSNMESVSVMEGDSVTLKSGATEILSDDEMEWQFSAKIIATISGDSGKSSTFKDRLQLDEQTGDLKISNIKTTDSGLYKLKISSPSGSPEMTFTVKVVSSDGAKTVTVNEGGSVTLNLTEILRDDVIRWRFGQQTSPVAEINRKAGIFRTYGSPDGRFSDRLQLDNQTGSLTITNITETHSGVYEVEIISSSSSSRYTIHHTQPFNVTVRDDVESESVLEGDSVTLHTGLTGIQIDDVILWKFGDQDKLIADLNGPVNEAWNNIQLNPQTGDLDISNFRNNQYGYYKVEINTARMILHKKYRITAVMVSVMAGDSVTLHPNFPVIQKKHSVSWFDGQDNIIARTRDLTIRNIQRNQSGDYKVKIISGSTVSDLHRKFHINITGVFSSEKDGVKSVSVVNGDSFTLHSNVTDIQNDTLIEWMFGPQNLSIAKTDGTSKKISYDKDVRFKNKVYLDIQTGDLRINNSSTEHSGLYQLKLINSRYTIQKSFRVTVGLSSGQIAGIVVGAIALLLAIPIGVICYRRCCKKPKKFSTELDKNPKLLHDETIEMKPPEKEEQ